MKHYGILFLMNVLIFGCQSNSSKVITSHPLEHNLIPNVEIASSPQRYTIPQRLEYHTISGLSLGIIEEGKLVFTKGYGFAVKDRMVPDSSTIFQVGSISKSILGLVSMILEDRGEISLDSLATTYLKEWSFPENRFSANENITLRHLLNHTAGLNIFNSWGMSPFVEPSSLEEVFEGNKYSKGVSIDTTAGAIYQYSNYGYGILQMALENHTGRSLEELSDELIFEPLGMKKSSFKRIVPSKELSGYAFAHDDEGNVYEEYWTQPLIPGSGGLKSTVKDLSVLLLAIQKAFAGTQQGLITPKMVKEITSRKGYNLGFEVDGEGESLSITHTGRVKGFFAYMRIYPETNNGIIMLCNSDNGGEVFKDILRGASEHYGWTIAQPRTIAPLQTSLVELQPYLGSYELQLEGTSYIAQILPDGEHLIFKMENEDETYPMRKVGTHQFVDLIDGTDLEFQVLNSKVEALVLDRGLKFIRKQ